MFKIEAMLPYVFITVMTVFISWKWYMICLKNRAKKEIDEMWRANKALGIPMIKAPAWLYKVFISIVALMSWYIFILVIWKGIKSLFVS